MVYFYLLYTYNYFSKKSKIIKENRHIKILRTTRPAAAKDHAYYGAKH